MANKSKTRKQKIHKSNKLNLFRKHHKIIFSLIGAVGAIMVWRGVWNLVDTAPFVNAPAISIILGLFLVAISGFFFKLL